MSITSKSLPKPRHTKRLEARAIAFGSSGLLGEGRSSGCSAQKRLMLEPKSGALECLVWDQPISYDELPRLMMSDQCILIFCTILMGLFCPLECFGNAAPSIWSGLPHRAGSCQQHPQVNQSRGEPSRVSSGESLNTSPTARSPTSPTLHLSSSLTSREQTPA